MPAPSSIPCLVVDDQQTMRSLVRTGLQQLGFRTIHEAADGEDGLRQMLSRPVQLVRMPDTSHFFHRRLMDLRGAVKNGVRDNLPPLRTAE